MTVAFGSAGSTGAGGLSASTTLPADVGQGDLLLVTCTTKPPGTAPITPGTGPSPPDNGWRILGRLHGGQGASGPDTGFVTATVFFKFAAGSESSEVVTLVAGETGTDGGGMIVRSWRYSKDAAKVWDIAAAVGQSNTPGTSWSATGDRPFGIASGDVVLAVSAANTDLRSFSAEAVAATGATFGSATERHDTGDVSGEDTRLVVSEHPVSSGASTSTPAFTMTASGATANEPAGATILIRLRERDAPASEWGAFSRLRGRQLTRANLDAQNEIGAVSRTMFFGAADTSVISADLAAAGAAAVSFVGSAAIASAVSAAGATTPSLVGAAAIAGAMTAAGAATPSFVGSAAVAGALSAAGAASPSLTSSAAVAGSLSAAGAGALAAVGSSRQSAALASAGVGAADFASGSARAAELASAGAGTLLAQAAAAVAVELSAAAAAAVALDGAATVGADLVAPGAATVDLVGNDGAASRADLQAAAAAAVAFAGGASRAGALAADGSAAAAYDASASQAADLASVGTADSAWDTSASVAAVLVAAGVGAFFPASESQIADPVGSVVGLLVEIDLVTGTLSEIDAVMASVVEADIVVEASMLEIDIVGASLAELELADGTLVEV